MDGLADNIRTTVKEDRNDVGVFFQKSAQNTSIATIMNNPNKIFIIRILHICFLGCLGTCNTNAFTTSRPFSCRVNCSREKRTVLSGGYYAEPEPSDQSQTHMLFGTRFREETWNVNGKSIITLMPQASNNGDDDDDVDENDISSSTTRILMQYLYDNNMFDLTNVSVLEVGASALSSIVCLAMGASSVTACHSDEQILRVLQHANQFLNASPSSPALFQTKLLRDGLSIPNADLIIVTTTTPSLVANNDLGIVEGLLRKAKQGHGRPVGRILLLSSNPLAGPLKQRLTPERDYREINGILDILPTAELF